jgi:hypothetical protein
MPRKFPDLQYTVNFKCKKLYTCTTCTHIYSANPPWLRADDATIRPHAINNVIIKNKLRDLGTFTTPSLATDHNHLVLPGRYHTTDFLKLGIKHEQIFIWGPNKSVDVEFKLFNFLQ